ncbi:hypothetical protein WDU94_011004, partial [Cyamophila willieti]
MSFIFVSVFNRRVWYPNKFHIHSLKDFTQDYQRSQLVPISPLQILLGDPGFRAGSRGWPHWDQPCHLLSRCAHR